MAINDKPYLPFEQDLPPELLAQLLALVPKGFNPNNQAPSGQTDAGATYEAPLWGLNPNDSMSPTAGYGADGKLYISQPRNVSTWGGNDMTGAWDENGKWLGFGGGATDLRGLANFVASSLGAYYGTDLVNNFSSAAAGGGGAGGGAAGGGMAGWDAAMADLAASGGIGAGDMAAATAAAAPAATSAATTATTPAWQQAGEQVLTKAANSGLNMGHLLGLAAGVADGKDKQQTTSRDPWAPAQPYLKGLLSDGADLYNQRKAQPFSQSQQTAYGNYGGLLDAINTNAPGLLSGFGANASGANNYDRSNPKKQLMGGSAMDLSSWLPGLLGSFGTGPR